MTQKPFVFTRRKFLQTTAVASLATMVPSFLAQPVLGRDPQRQGGERILVVIQLGGGNDGLNTIVPYASDDYHKARPQLGLKKKEVIPITDEIAFHQSLSGLKSLYDNGQLAVLNGVGYPNPNRSHFRSMEIWHTATDSNKYSRTGWLGRYFDNSCEGAPNPSVGINIGGDPPQAFTSTAGAGISFQNPNSFRWIGGKGATSEKVFHQLNHVPGKVTNDVDILDFLRHTTTNIVTSSDRVRRAAQTKRRTADYPTSRLSGQLKNIATLIAAGMPTRIYYTSISGFDTHAGQQGPHANLLNQFSQAVSAFQKDLKLIGAQDRVVTMCFSEFGRRVEQNASGGTDHGTAGPMFLLGNKIKPGLHGKYPNLADLDSGDLKYTTDFRGVYAEVLDQWLGVNSKEVLKGRFKPVGVIA